jgi:uncharacterized small protein (DUF1192 family)
MSDIEKLRDHYGKRIAELTTEIERLRAVLSDVSVKLKLLYMAAGLGQKTGREALAALSDEINKIDAALRPEPEIDHSEPPMICPVTGQVCEFCEEYGCARKAGFDVDGDLYR